MPSTMNICLTNQNPHSIHWCIATDSWGLGSSLPPCPFPDGQGRAVKIQKAEPAWLIERCTNQQSRSKEKGLGHFTVSSQEEQIASALHDHSRDWPERGLCLPRGKQEWHGLAAQGGMWSGVTGTRVAWEAALFAAAPSHPPSPIFSSVFPTSTQSCNSGSNCVIQRCRQCAASLVSLTKNILKNFKNCTKTQIYHFLK